MVYALRFPDGLLLLEPAGMAGDRAAIKLFPVREMAADAAEVFQERPMPIPVKVVVKGGGYRVSKRTKQVRIFLESNH